MTATAYLLLARQLDIDVPAHVFEVPWNNDMARLVRKKP